MGAQDTPLIHWVAIGEEGARRGPNRAGYRPSSRNPSASRLTVRPDTASTNSSGGQRGVIFTARSTTPGPALGGPLQLGVIAARAKRQRNGFLGAIAPEPAVVTVEGRF